MLVGGAEALIRQRDRTGARVVTPRTLAILVKFDTIYETEILFYFTFHSFVFTFNLFFAWGREYFA